MAKATEVKLEFNRPQFTSYGWLFDENGQVRRRRTVMLPWGRGVGKSWFRRQIWWTLVAQFDGKKRQNCLKQMRGVRVTSLMPTLKQFKDVHGSDIETELAPNGPWGFLCGKYDRQSGQISFPGGSWVKPFPATAHNSKTSRGMRTDVLDADELDDIDAAVYDAVAIPFLSEPWSLGLELPGGTPTRGRHGLWWRTLEATRLGRRLRRGEIDRASALNVPAAKAVREVFESLPSGEWPDGIPRDPEDAALAVLSTYFGRHSTYRDAPETVSALAVARAKATTPKATFEREWEANPDAGEGLVYGGAYEESFHVRPAPASAAWSEFLIGCDHGYEDPGVFLLIGVLGSGRDAVSWVLEEVYEQHRTEDWWKAKLKVWIGKYPSAKFYGDPSMPARIEAYRRDCRAKVQEVDNSIEDGIAVVADRFLARSEFEAPDASGEQKLLRKHARLYIAPNCVNTIRELGLYKRRADTQNQGRYTDDIVDRDNHAPDALRYAIFNRFKNLRSYFAA